MTTVYRSLIMIRMDYIIFSRWLVAGLFFVQTYLAPSPLHQSRASDEDWIVETVVGVVSRADVERARCQLFAR